MPKFTKARPFTTIFASLTSGPVVVQVLRGENAVAKESRRDGRHQPGQCPGTIRKEFAGSIEANSVHGSDSAEECEEIAFFFAETEIVG